MAKTKLPQQKVKKKTAEKEKPATSQIPPDHPKQFLPVLLENGEKTELPIEAVIASAVFDPTKPHPTSEHHFTLMIEREKETSYYYVRPSDVEKYILDQNKTPVDFERVNKKAIETLHDLKKAWIRFGAAILDVNTLRTYRLKYPTFGEFCEQELRLHRSTVYEVMTSTLFLMQEKPEVYQALLQGDMKIEETLPSYRSLYLVAKKKPQLEKKEKYQEIVEALLQNKLSTREVQTRIKEVLGGDKEKEHSWQAFLSNFEKIYTEMEELEIPKDLKSQTRNVLEQLKKFEM